MLQPAGQEDVHSMALDDILHCKATPAEYKQVDQAFELRLYGSVRHHASIVNVLLCLQIAHRVRHRQCHVCIGQRVIVTMATADIIGSYSY